MADLNDIINTLIAEANAEGPEGMRRVAETILNRAAIRGIDPAQVVRQPYQYTGYYAPGPAAVAAQRDPAVRSAAEAAWELARQPGDPTGGADHYHANYVSPGWADAMPRTGQYGQHLFYRSREVPAEALAALLTPQNRDVPLPRPRPASPMDQIARLFSGTAANAGAAQRPEMNAGLDQHIARQQARASLTLPGQADSYVGAAAASQDPVLARVLETFAQKGPSPAPRAVPPMPTNVVQSYAGQDRAPASPSRPVPAMPTGVAQSYAGQERAPVTPSTAKAVADLLAPSRPQSYAAQEARPAQTSNIGKPPTTRVVQTRSFPGTSTPSRMDDVGGPVTMADIAAIFAPVPYASSSVNTKKDQSRLSPRAAVIDRDSSDLATALGLEQPRTAALGYGPTVPLPKPRPQPANTRIAVTGQVPNPAYQRMLAQVERGELELRGLSASGQARSRDAYTRAQEAAKALAAQRAQLASIPKTITRTTTQAPARTTVPRAPAPEPVSFAGRSTGNRYVAGQQYTMDGDTYRANADGSFVNERTGRILAGSSGMKSAASRVNPDNYSSDGGGRQPTGTIW